MKLRNLSYLMLLLVTAAPCIQAKARQKAEKPMKEMMPMGKASAKSTFVTITNNTKYDIPKMRVVFGFIAEKNMLRPHAKEIRGSVKKENVKAGETVTFYASDATFGSGKREKYVMPNIKGLKDVCIREIHEGSLHKNFNYKKGKKKGQGTHQKTFVINRKNRKDVLSKDAEGTRA